VAIDTRYHGERGNMKQYSAAIDRTFAGKGHEHPLYYDTVWDVMRLIDYLQTRPDVDPKRVGLMGISKGGVETWLAAAADERIACSVPCIGMQSFRWEVDHDAWHARMNVLKESFNASAKSIGAKPDGEFVKQYFERVCPGSLGEFDGPSMAAATAPRPLLMINGGKDGLTPIDAVNVAADAARAAYKAAGAEDHFKQIVEEGKGHTVTPESYDAILAWFDGWLKK
jgi:dienelactone hydrolase